MVSLHSNRSLTMTLGQGVLSQQQKFKDIGHVIDNGADEGWAKLRWPRQSPPSPVCHLILQTSRRTMVQAGCVGCLLNSTARHLKGAVLVCFPAPRIKCPDKAIQGREGLFPLTVKTQSILTGKSRQWGLKQLVTLSHNQEAEGLNTTGPS